METVTSGKRAESRAPARVGVDLRSLDLRAPAQGGVTDNVSARGARVLTSLPWKPNERLKLRSLPGSLKSQARVVYCEPTGEGLFAIGLRLYACVGNWESPR
jgi:hypothetical protein